MASSSRPSPTAWQGAELAPGLLGISLLETEPAQDAGKTHVASAAGPTKERRMLKKRHRLLTGRSPSILAELKAKRPLGVDSGPLNCH